jgi:hypothetical protein
MFMTRASPHRSSTLPRLVHLLTGLAVADAELSHSRFAERLGQFVDLPDSIALSALHGRLAALDSGPATMPREEIREEFLRLRGTIVQSLIQGFIAGAGSTRTRLPDIAGEELTAEALEYEPYRRFYVAQQREVDFRTRNLHARVREAAAGLSPELARLCALDSALGNILATHARRFFATIPKLLQARFDHLLGGHTAATAAGKPAPREALQQTLGQFCGEMQALLLAEIEARLLPALGLVEALEESSDNP